jgi:hypothetical protein
LKQKNKSECPFCRPGPAQNDPQVLSFSGSKEIDEDYLDQMGTRPDILTSVSDEKNGKTARAGVLQQNPPTFVTCVLIPDYFYCLDPIFEEYGNYQEIPNTR